MAGGGGGAPLLAVREAPALPTIERVKALLALCLTVDEAAELRDQARAVEAYYAQRADSLDIQNQAAAIRFRAERRIGELLKAMPKNKGGRPSETGSSETPVPTLAEIGITKKQASIWQRIASLAEGVFEDRLSEAQENGLELTTSRVLFGEPSANQKRRAAALARAAEECEADDSQRESAVRVLNGDDSTWGELGNDLPRLARIILNEWPRAKVEKLRAILAGGQAADEREPEEEP